MMRRFSSRAVFGAACSTLLPALLAPAMAQTRPNKVVRAAPPTEARALVQRLLKEGKIMRSSDVKRGMKGYGLSVFEGTKIEKFPIEVIGNLEKTMGGGDLVLIRVTGGTVVKRSSGIVAGMSGSPVFINGKMLGAIAIGFGFPKEPIGGVTPITQMLETSLPAKTPAAKSSAATSASTKNASAKALASTRAALLSDETYRPRQPLTVGGKQIARVVVSRDTNRLALSGDARAATMTMRPATTLLQVSGMSLRGIEGMRKTLAPYGIEPVLGAGASGASTRTALGGREVQIIGPSSKKTGVAPPFTEGGALGVQLVSGDIDMSAVGTITYRLGNRILGFGHPMFGIGAVSIPMSTSYIHDIFPSYQSSFKLASPVKTVGVLQQDNKYAVGGTVGAIPETVPFRLTMTNKARGINRVLNMKVMKDPLLTPSLMQQVTQETLSDTLGMDSNKMVRINFAMKVKNAPEIRRSNYVYAQDEVTSAALGDMLGSLVLTQANPFSRGNIERVSLNVQVEPKRQTAILKSIFADRNRARAGETVNISVVLETQPPPAKTYTRVFSFRIPADAPSGLLRVAAGPASEYWTLRTRVGDAPPSPDSLNDLVTEFNKAGSSTDLQVQVSTPSTFLIVDKTRVPNPPATWEKLLRAAPSTSVGSYNEVQSQTQTTSLALSGMQLLALPVESARISDKVAPDSSAAATDTQGVGTDSGTITPAPVTPDASADLPSEAPPNFAMPDGGDGDSAATRGGNFAPISFAPREYSQLISATISTDNLRAQATNWWSGVAQLAVNAKRARVSKPATEVAAGRRLAPDTRAISATRQELPDAIELADDAPQQVPGREPTVRPIVTPTAAPLPNLTPQPTAKPIVTPTPAPTTPAEGATLGRPARSWVQGNAVDFARGDFRGAEVTSEGTLRAAALGKRIATTTEPFAWSVAADSRGNTFLGTGNNARILKVDARGTTTTLYNGREVAITALAVDGADNLYAGVSPGGRVLRFGAGISAPVTVSQTLETFIWALDFDADGNLIVATGGTRGALYRISKPATALAPTTRIAAAAGTQYVADRPFATVPQKHIRALSISKDGIFAGTSDDAVLYQIDAKSGEAKPLFQQVMPAAAAAASTRNSAVVTASSPGGSSGLPSSVFFLLRSAQEGDASSASIPTNTARPEILAVAAAPEGVYFGLSNSGTLYRYNAASGVQAIYPSPQNAIYALRRDRDGSIVAATGEKGIVYRITPREDGRAAVGARILEPTQSQALSLGFAPRGDLLIGTGNNAALYRVDANQREGTFVSNVFDAGNLVNWGALRVLGSGVGVETRSGNTEEPDASWSAWQSAARNDLNELRVVSPSARFLQYRAQLSGQDAKLSRLEVIYRTQNGAPSIAFSSPKGAEFWRATQKLSWTGTDPDGDTLRYKLWLSSDDGATWKSVALKAPTSSTGELDTTKFADGMYRLRVEASDVARNPVDPKTAQTVSLPFTIDNTAPVISVARAEKGAPDNAASTRDDAGQPQWTLRATATDATSPIIGAEWRLISAAQLEAENKKAAAAKAAVTGDDKATPTVTPTPAASTRGTKTPTAKATPTPTVGSVKTASITPSGGTLATVPELVPVSGAMVGAAVGAGALPDDSSAAAAGWQAVAAADGLFDSRREDLLAVVEETPPTSTDAGAKTSAPAAPTSLRILQLRVRDAAGNTATTTVPLP